MKIEFLLFQGPPFKIYCNFENGYLMRLYLKGQGLSDENKLKYLPRADHPFFKELENYFNGRLQKFTQKFIIENGTEFQMQVWQALSKIKYGKVISYKELSFKIDRPGAQRSLGAALSKNPLPLIVPCHRVVRTNGNAGNFTGGDDIKMMLLKLEGAL